MTPRNRPMCVDPKALPVPGYWRTIGDHAPSAESAKGEEVARYKKSEPLKALTRNLDRAGYFVSISKSAASLSRTKEYRELPRASLVFTIGAFDAFLSEITADVLVTSLTSGAGAVTNSIRARNAIQTIVRALPTLTLEVALMEDARGREALARTAIVEHFHTNVSNHGKKAVDQTIEIIDHQRNIKGFWDSVGADARCDRIIREVKARIANDRAARRNTTKPAREFPKRLDASNLLDYWTDRRHQIVHQGADLSVWREEAASCNQLIALLGDKADRLAQA